MGCALSQPAQEEAPSAKKPRVPGTAAPLTEDEKLKSRFIDGGINFTGKDAHWPDVRRCKSGFLDRTTALAASRNMPAFLVGLPGTAMLRKYFYF